MNINKDRIGILYLFIWINYNFIYCESILSHFIIYSLSIGTINNMYINQRLIILGIIEYAITQNVQIVKNIYYICVLFKYMTIICI